MCAHALRMCVCCAPYSAGHIIRSLTSLEIDFKKGA